MLDPVLGGDQVDHEWASKRNLEREESCLSSTLQTKTSKQIQNVEKAYAEMGTVFKMVTLTNALKLK